MKRPTYEESRDIVLENVQSSEDGQMPNYTPQTTQNTTDHMVNMMDSNRGRANTGIGAGVGAAVLALGVGVGAGFAIKGVNDRIDKLDTRVSSVETTQDQHAQRIGPDELAIRNYMLDGNCIALGGDVDESNNDAQRGYTDCTFTGNDFGNNPYKFAKDVIKSDYWNKGDLKLADSIDDRTLDNLNRWNLESLLSKGYAGIVANSNPNPSPAPTYHNSTPQQNTRVHNVAPQPAQEVGSDSITINSGFLGLGKETRVINNDTNLGAYAQFAQFADNYNCGEFRVNGVDVKNPVAYIYNANSNGGVNQRFRVTCQPSRSFASNTPDGGGNGPTGSGSQGGGRGGPAGGQGGQSTN